VSDIFWKNDGWESEDRHLSRLRAMPFRRRWPFIPEAKGLYVIRGPRQIGKTSWLKSILAAYAKSKDCFFLSCENVENNRELSLILKSVRTAELIILDEVSFVEHWDRAVKHFIDGGYQGILCVSGSHAYDLEKGADLMPGRFDGGGEFHLLPMTFDEFREARVQAGWDTGDHVTELLQFFKTGGFPDAVASAGALGRPSSKIRETYLRWLKGDAKKLGKDPEKVVEILIQIFKTIQNPISFQTLAKKTSIGSPNTVIDYVRLLEASFAIRSLYAIDVGTGALRHRSDKKFYFTDPMLYWISCHLAGERTPEQANDALAETVAHEHLARLYDRIGFFRSKKGEIDFMQANKWCVEVKWSPVAENISKAFYDAVTPEKIVWTQRNFLQEYPQCVSGDTRLVRN
jgi:predicted AAA+ superfamily ATPase